MRPATQLQGNAGHIDNAHDVSILFAEHGDGAAGARLLDAHAGGLKRNRVSDPLCTVVLQLNFRHLCGIAV